MKTGNFNIVLGDHGTINISIEDPEKSSQKNYVAEFDPSEREVIDRVVKVMDAEPLPNKLEPNKTYKRQSKNFMPELIMQMSRRRPLKYYK